MSPGQVTAKSFFHRIGQWRGEFSFTNLQVSQNMSNCVYMLSMKLVSALPSRDIAEIDWATTWERRSYAPFSLDSQASVHPPYDQEECPLSIQNQSLSLNSQPRVYETSNNYSAIRQPKHKAKLHFYKATIIQESFI